MRALADRESHGRLDIDQLVRLSSIDLPDPLPSGELLIHALAGGHVSAEATTGPRGGTVVVFDWRTGSRSDNRRFGAVARWARGLAVDLSGATWHVASWPMPAFVELSFGQPLPAAKHIVSVTEKLDGALVLNHWVDGHMGWHGRSSFHSVPAVHAAKIWRQSPRVVEEGLSLACEVIHPDLTPVIHDQRRRLVLVAVTDRVTGHEWTHRDVVVLADELGLEAVPEVPWDGRVNTLWRTLLDAPLAREGYVLRSIDSTRLRLVDPAYGPLYDLLADPTRSMISVLWADGVDVSHLLPRVPSTALAEFRRTWAQLDAVAARLAGTGDPGPYRRVAASIFRASRRDLTQPLWPKLSRDV